MHRNEHYNVHTGEKLFPAISGPVCTIATGLSTPQGDAFFPEFSQQTYQSDIQIVDDSSDSQQHAMAQRSHCIRRASSVVEHGDPSATAMSTNIQSNTVEMALFNHGLVTQGQSPGFIDGQILTSQTFSPAPFSRKMV
ncbi:hypothetical protein BM221_010757 [Beauveria bassiana]|uniref:Uncharacterized protein n=1 Tax=Beauveria bassiana TaxID=176275 RepID=A0A2N6N809_BEABA|nr:hypothetical protein BM221_010757 [Beauveria bassiana]